MQRSKLFTAILFSIAIMISGFASAQAQGKKKVPPKGTGQSGQSPKPIGIQVADPVNRDNAKVQVQSAGVRQVGLNVIADVSWTAVAPQGSRLESFDVEVIGDFGGNSGVSEKLSFGGTTTGGQLFLAEAAAHPASEFRNINAKVVANFRDLNNNQLFSKGAVKNFAVSVKPSAPVKPEVNPAKINVSPVVISGLSASVRWDVVLKPGTVIDRFTVQVNADLDNGQSISRKELSKEVNDPNAREVTFTFAQIGAGSAPVSRIAKTRTVVNASVRTLADNSFSRLSAFREDVFSLPVKPETKPAGLNVLPVQADGTRVFPRWEITVSPEFILRSFEVAVTADLQQGQAVKQQTQGRQLTAEDRSTAFDFGQSISLAPRIAKLRTVVVATLQSRLNNQIEKVTAERTDSFATPTPLPVVNLNVSELKTSLNNLVSVSWTINVESQVRIIEFQIKLATTFSNDTASISEFKASPQARSFIRSFLPKDGPPNGFRQVFATVTARMEAPDGRRFDVVASRKLN